LTGATGNQIVGKRYVYGGVFFKSSRAGIRLPDPKQRKGASSSTRA
jgi:hypothetical protein